MPALPDPPQTQTAIIALTNEFRRQQKRDAVTPNRHLAAAARWFADYLARTGKFAHEADGREPQQRAEAHGYKYCMVAENLALNLDSRGFTSNGLAHDAMEGWKASPPHRRNLLEPGVTEIGVAIARAPGNDPKFLTVQLLGRPDSLRVDFKIVNTAHVAVSYTIAGEDGTIEPRTVVTHSVCKPGPLTFRRAGGWWSGADLDVAFEPKSGATYTVRDDDTTRVRIEAQSGGDSAK